MLVTSCLGSRPTSSANRQNNTRLRKCATASGSCPRCCMERARSANREAAAWVTSSGVCCGRSDSGSLITARRMRSASAVLSPPSARSSSVSVVNGRSGVGEVGVDLDPVHVANDERGRILQVFAVVKQLPIGGGEVGVVALVLPAEVFALPDVGPTPIASAQSFGAGLERVPLTACIGLVRRLHAEQATEVDEVLLRGGTLTTGVVAPLGGELGSGEGSGYCHFFSQEGSDRASSLAEGDPLSLRQLPLRGGAGIMVGSSPCEGERGSW